MMNSGVMALVCGGLAQVAKVVLELAVRRRWRPGLVFENGGMPSSHTATVVALTMNTYRLEGWTSPLFSLVVIFGLFVVVEATGLRQEIGHQAQVLNELMDRALAGEKMDRRRLRELVGHTWGEVTVGFLFGLAVALVAFR